MAFGMGFVQGLATSTDEALKTHIKDNKDRFDKNLEAALSRNLERSTRYETDVDEAEEALELMAGLTGGDLGKATAAIKGLGGYKQVQGFVDAYRKGLQTDPDLTFEEVVKFVHGEVPEITHQQAINQLVKPLEFAIPKAGTKPKNWYQKLTSDPRSMAGEIPRIMRERGITPTQVDNLLKVQNAKINYNAIATPEQRFALGSAHLANQTKQVQLDTAKQALFNATKNNQILAERVKYAPESERLKHQELALAVKTKAFNYETARRYDRKTLEIGYAVQEATLLEKRSGTDYEETLAKIDTQLVIYDEELRVMEVAAKAGEFNLNSNRYKTIQAKRDSTFKHRANIAKDASKFGASSSSIHGKINPISDHRSKVRHNMTAAGVDYDIGADGELELVYTGQGPSIFKAFQQTYQQLRAESSQFPQMHSSIMSAYSQQVGSASTIISNKFDLWKAERANINPQTKKPIDQVAYDKFKPKQLYQTKKVNGVLQFVRNDQGKKLFNPNLRKGDLVIINSKRQVNQRKEVGYNMDTYTTEDGQPLAVFIDKQTLLGDQDINKSPEWMQLRKEFRR